MAIAKPPRERRQELSQLAPPPGLPLPALPTPVSAENGAGAAKPIAAEPLSTKPKSIDDYMSELSQTLPKEVARRKKWLKSLPLIQDSGYKDSDISETVLSGIRAEISHGIIGDPSHYMWHAGGDPHFYCLDLKGREKDDQWRVDFQDKCDRVSPQLV